MAVIPNAPASLDAAKLGTLLNLDGDTAAEVLQLAVTTVNREFAGAFRDVPQDVYDDCVRKVAGAIVAGRRKPAGNGAGQLTRTDQAAPPQLAAPRDYATPIRPTLALYVAPL